MSRNYKKNKFQLIGNIQAIPKISTIFAHDFVYLDLSSADFTNFTTYLNDLGRRTLKQKKLMLGNTKRRDSLIVDNFGFELERIDRND